MTHAGVDSAQSSGSYNGALEDLPRALRASLHARDSDVGEEDYGEEVVGEDYFEEGDEGDGDEGAGEEEREEQPEKPGGGAELPFEKGVGFLLPPPFPGLDPTLAFGEPEELRAMGLKEVRKPKLYVKLGSIANNAVRQAFTKAGYRRIKGVNWHTMWSSALKTDEYKNLQPFHKVNHFPGTWELGRKDKLYRNVVRMRRMHGAAFEIMPRSWLLPGDHEEFRQEIDRYPDSLYIMKPVASSRGRGVRMVKDPSAIPRDKECMVQRYIREPHLINGYKYDLRIYVVVTSFDPLRVYVYEDGLVRFATEKYIDAENNLKKKCMHVTNYSVNSKKANFKPAIDETDDGKGSKWSLAALRQHFGEQGIEWVPIWAQIKDIVAKVMISVEGKVNTLFKMHVSNPKMCYEVFGFDVVLDASLRCWLLEVNTGPALMTPTPLDKRIKFAMVTDMLHMVGFTPVDRIAHEKKEEAKRRARLTGIGAREKPRKRDLREALDLDFSKIAPADLPLVVKEAEAEDMRSGRFERVFPSAEHPEWYHDLFESLRYDNVLLSRYLLQRPWQGVDECGQQSRRPASSRRESMAPFETSVSAVVMEAVRSGRARPPPRPPMRSGGSAGSATSTGGMETFPGMVAGAGGGGGGSSLRSLRAGTPEGGRARTEKPGSLAARVSSFTSKTITAREARKGPQGGGSRGTAGAGGLGSKGGLAGRLAGLQGGGAPKVKAAGGGKSLPAGSSSRCVSAPQGRRKAPRESL